VRLPLAAQAAAGEDRDGAVAQGTAGGQRRGEGGKEETEMKRQRRDRRPGDEARSPLGRVAGPQPPSPRPANRPPGLAPSSGRGGGRAKSEPTAA